MKYVVLSVILLSGCSLFDTPHEKSKVALKQEIEILELKKRKAFLQFQIEKLEKLELEDLED